MKPSIGRIVIFKNGPASWPAIVTYVYPNDDDNVDLCVFQRHTNERVFNVPSSKSSFTVPWVCWAWPEIVR